LSKCTLDALHVTGKEHKKLNKVNLNQHENHEALKEKLQTFMYHRKREKKNVTKHFFPQSTWPSEMIDIFDKDRLIEDI